MVDLTHNYKFDGTNLTYKLTPNLWDGVHDNIPFNTEVFTSGSQATSSTSNQSVFTFALQTWDAFSIFNFSSTTGSADIYMYDVNMTYGTYVFGLFGDPIIAYTGVFEDDVSVIADIPANSGNYTRSEIVFDGSSFSNYTAAARTYVAIHEIGHALGLDHPNGDPDDSNYNSDMTVMSYNIAGSNGTRTAITPMPFDIIAIEDQYGGSAVYNPTDSYGDNFFDGSNRSQTIYDTGGTNSFDLSNVSGNHTINLNQAIDANDNWTNSPTIVNGQEYVYIARGTVIENAIGGAGDDTIYGNGSNNILDGGSGTDTVYLSGNYGNDTIKNVEIIYIGDEKVFDSTATEDETAEQPDGEDSYYHNGFEIEEGANGGLIVKGGGNEIFIEDWDATTNNYGIVLEDSPEGGQNPGAENLDPSFLAAADLYDFSRAGFRTSDPLVLDLDGDGIELLNIETSNVYFDLNGDGIVNHVGWVAPDDGLLVRDLNHNGVIDDISELYGNPDQNGFDELSEDETLNGTTVNQLVNNADNPLFDELQIWQDLNSDGLVQAGELSSLASHNIVEFDVRTASILPDNRWIQGNQVVEVSQFTRGDSSTGDMYEALLRLESIGLDAGTSGIYTGSDANLLALPQSRGYGQLDSWQDAMDTNTTLRSMMESFVAQTPYENVDQEAHAILYEWAGAAAINPDSRGGLFDARKLAVLEALFDTAFTADSGNPGERRAGILTETWDNVYNMFKARLLVQGTLEDVFPNASYDFSTDTLTLGDSYTTLLSNFDTYGDTGNLNQLLDMQSVLSLYASQIGTTQVAVYQEFAERVSGVLGAPGAEATFIAAFESSSVVDTTTSKQWGYNGPTEEVLLGSFRNDLIEGDSGDNFLEGGDGVDLLIGGGGDDVLVASTYTSGGSILSGDGDMLFGGVGNDEFLIKSGSNYLVSGGDGDDVFKGNALQSSTIDGGAGADSFSAFGGTNLNITLGDGDDNYTRSGNTTIFLQDSYIDLGEGDDYYFDMLGHGNTVSAGDGNDFIRIEHAVFVDGGAGNDTINGGTTSTGSIYGGDGDDTLGTYGAINVFGDDGNDTITFGGTSTIDGGLGDDSITRITGGSSSYTNLTAIIGVDPGASDTIDLNYWYDSTSQDGQGNTIYNYTSHINLVGFSTVGDFGDLTVTASGSDSIVGLPDGQQILIKNMTPGEITADMFDIPPLPDPDQTLNGTLTGSYVEAALTTTLDLGTYQFLDWNNDGQMDIVSQFGDSGNDLVWYDGRSLTATTIAANTDFGNYRIADWNNDGQLDIIANKTTGGFGWYSGGNPGSYTQISYNHLGNFEVGDINGDGTLEIVSDGGAYGSGTAITGGVWYNASGTMTRLTYNQLNVFKLADVDADGSDNVISNDGIYGSGSPIGGLVTYNAAGTMTRHAYVSDDFFQWGQFDNDNALELTSNEGTYTSGSPVTGAVLMEGSSVLTRVTYNDLGYYVAMDMDGDGLDELVSTAATYQNGNPDDGIRIYEANGTNTRVSYDNASAVFGTDWDGDGLKDLIVTGDDFGAGLTRFVAQGANDTLTGGSGNDTITGGRGDDSLTGGAGADIFRFIAEFDEDVITDFEAGTDKLSFLNVGGISTAQDVLNAVSIVGADSVITFSNGDIITLTGVTNLTTADVMVG